jgi:hypothetical protein
MPTDEQLEQARISRSVAAAERINAVDGLPEPTNNHKMMSNPEYMKAEAISRARIASGINHERVATLANDKAAADYTAKKYGKP